MIFIVDPIDSLDTFFIGRRGYFIIWYWSALANVLPNVYTLMIF